MNLDALNPFILPEAPGCPLPMVEWAVLQSAIRFCRETHVVSYDADPITVQPGKVEYDIDLRSDQEQVEMIVLAELDGRILTSPHKDSRRFHLPSGQGYMLLSDGTLELLRAPTVEGVLELEVAVAPVTDATEIPDELLRYADGVAAGALMRLLVMPNKAWTNPQRAVVAAATNRAEINAALVYANRRHARAPMRVTAPRFA